MHRFQVQFSEDLWSRLTLRAEQEGKSITDILRVAADAYLEQDPVVIWRGDPIVKLKGRFHTRERFSESIWRML